MPAGGYGSGLGGYVASSGAPGQEDSTAYGGRRPQVRSNDGEEWLGPRSERDRVLAKMQGGERAGLTSEGKSQEGDSIGTPRGSDATADDSKHRRGGASTGPGASGANVNSPNRNWDVRELYLDEPGNLH